jgi:hypothetical protein
MLSENLYSVYPSHIYDPVRRTIAVEIMGKEMAKLIGHGGGKELELLREKVSEWYDGVPKELAPVHDFWSIFEMLLLAKTKRISRFITAANVDWRREVKLIDSLILAWMPFVGNRPEIFGPGPWLIADLRARFDTHPELDTERQEYVQRYFAHYKFDREEPITLVQQPDEQFLLDGNGRLYWAFMTGKMEINSWTGYMPDEPLRDFWVSTGLQRRLCYDILENEMLDPELSGAALTQLRRQLQTNRVARINYDLWVRKRFPQLDSMLFL